MSTRHAARRGAPTAPSAVSPLAAGTGRRCPDVNPSLLPLQGGASTSYRLLPVKLTGPAGGPAVTRYLYIKQHASPADGLPKERALFVAGIPAALQGPPLVELFARFGEVERAALHGSRVSAVLLYHAAEGLAALLKAVAKGRPFELRLPEPEGPCGLKGGQSCGVIWLRCIARSINHGCWLPCCATSGIAPDCLPVWAQRASPCSLGGGAQGAETRQRRAAGGAG